MSHEAPFIDPWTGEHVTWGAIAIGHHYVARMKGRRFSWHVWRVSGYGTPQHRAECFTRQGAINTAQRMEQRPR